MIESFLVSDRQDLGSGRATQLVYGQSVTDACIGWDATEIVLEQLADAIDRRRELVTSAGPGSS
jgi:3-deoxy-7-phosphoheptulonate synthase